MMNIQLHMDSFLRSFLLGTLLDIIISICLIKLAYIIYIYIYIYIYILGILIYYSYLHPTNIRRTSQFLLVNQIAFVMSHILSWLTYSFVTYQLYGSTTVLRFFVPSMIAVILISPCLCIIHWRINLRYCTQRK